MPNKRYISGRAFEYEVKRHLEAEGYFVVRSAGSHGPVDLVAIKDGHVWLIQCKKDGKISPADCRKLRKLETHDWLHVVLVWKALGEITTREVVV